MNIEDMTTAVKTAITAIRAATPYGTPYYHAIRSIFYNTLLHTTVAN